MGEKHYEMMLINTTGTELLVQKGERVGRVRSRNGTKLVAFNTPDTVQTRITKDQINYNQHFTDQQVNIFVDLLNKYRKCFSFNLNELGCTNMNKMDIQVDGEPIAYKLYKASVSECEIIDKIVSE